jgi:uncharacterized BrkB/YihY/UPF0761 family membrane protein
MSVSFAHALRRLDGWQQRRVALAIPFASGSGLGPAVGLIGGLWTGFGVTLAIGTALDRTWDVPQLQRRGFVSSRLRPP